MSRRHRRPRHGPRTWTRSAVYTALPPEEQATLRAQAEAVLIQKGTKRAFLVWPAILSTIGGLLEAQAAGTLWALAPHASDHPPPLGRPTSLEHRWILLQHARSQCPATRRPPVPTSVWTQRDRKPKKGKLPAPTSTIPSRTSKRSVGSWCSSTRRGRRADRADRARPADVCGHGGACVAWGSTIRVVSLPNCCRTSSPDRPERCRRRGRPVLLNAHEYGTDPERRAAPHRRPASRLPSPTMPASSNSPRVLGQDGWHGDPFLAVKLQYPEWTRALGPGRRRA